MKPTHILLIYLAVSPHVTRTNASFWDSIPIISQIKSAVQAATGDLEGAKQTQENFRDTAPGVSQIHSAIQAAQGDKKGAEETQKKFLKNAEQIVDSTPIVGHIKGGIHIATGDKEHGLDIIKGASSTTGAVIGGLLGGPAGALAGQTLVDGVITVADSATNKEHRPFGIIDYVDRVDSASAGEHFDQIFGIGLDFAGGKAAKGKNKGKVKGSDGSPVRDIPNLPKQSDWIDSPGKPKESSSVPSSSGDLFSGERPIPFEVNHMPRVGDDMSIFSKSSGTDSHFLLDREGDFFMDDIGKLDEFRKKATSVPESHKNYLEYDDFRKLNNVEGKFNCYQCTLAGLTGKSISELSREYSIHKLENVFTHTDVKRMNVDDIVDRYRKTAFPDAKVAISGSAHDIHQFLATHLPEDGSMVKFGLGYDRATGNGHIILGKAWKENGQVRTLFVDFQRKGVEEGRFATELPHDGVKFHIIEPGPIKYEPEAFHSPVDKMDLNSNLFGPNSPQAASSVTHLESKHRNRLSTADFIKVKDVNFGHKRCQTCLLAIISGHTISGLAKSKNLQVDELESVDNIVSLVEVYKKFGYSDTRLTFSGNKEELETFLRQKLAPKTSTAVVLAYEPRDKSLGIGTVMLRVWKDSDNLEYIITDFDLEPTDKRRFKRSFDELEGGYDRLNLIVPLKKKVLTYENVLQEVNDIDLDIIKTGAGCENKKLVGYFTSWSKDSLSIKQAARFNHIIYAFIKMNADATLELPNDTISRQRLVDGLLAREALSTRGVSQKLMFAIGGWENSGHYSKIVSDASQRSKLIESISGFIDLYKFDGVDIDWEYPITGGAIEGRKEDRANYVIFLKELRETLGPKKVISIAAAAGEEASLGFDVKNIIRYVDWIGVMTYDFNGAWDSKWGEFVGPNAPLHHAAPPGYSGKLNANWALKKYTCLSQNPSKIIMGLPFYGRYWAKTIDGRDPQGYPLFRKAVREGGNLGGSVSYKELKVSWVRSAANMSSFWDGRSQTPWAMSRSSSLVLTYDNPESLAIKIDYALSNKLGGLMVWSLDQDDDELSMSSEVLKMCRGTDSSLEYKCNPLGDEKRWWTWTESQNLAGMCGFNAPIRDGFYPRCDPDDPGYSCCSEQGYCGSGKFHCDCPKCVDYSKYPHLLLAEPQKPSRDVSWHIGFELAKSGEPRCGEKSPRLNGTIATCNPDGPTPCCSEWGFCGSSPDHCQCSACKDYRK